MASESVTIQSMINMAGGNRIDGTTETDLATVTLVADTEPFPFVTVVDGRVELAPGHTAVVEWGSGGRFERVLQMYPTNH